MAASNTRFTQNSLGQSKTPIDSDHGIYRAAAIVGQPCDTNTAIADARAIAAKIGLTLHVPPNLTASWWYPGSTRFFVFTRPEIDRVHFLPEQMEAARGMGSKS